MEIHGKLTWELQFPCNGRVGNKRHNRYYWTYYDNLRKGVKEGRREGEVKKENETERGTAEFRVKSRRKTCEETNDCWKTKVGISCSSAPSKFLESDIICFSHSKISLKQYPSLRPAQTSPISRIVCPRKTETILISPFLDGSISWFTLGLVFYFCGFLHLTIEGS